MHDWQIGSVEMRVNMKSVTSIGKTLQLNGLLNRLNVHKNIMLRIPNELEFLATRCFPRPLLLIGDNVELFSQSYKFHYVKLIQIQCTGNK